MKVLKEDQIPFEIIITKTDKSNQKDLYKNTIALQNMYEKYF
jgi:GTP-binding protein EngB required for normal cell division